MYKSMKATGVRYLQFIPCLDPLGAQRGIENYSLSPELYAQFLCALFDAWYRDWKTGVYVSVRLFEDYIQLLMGAPTGTCSTTGACGSYMVVEGSGAVYPCDFYCLDEYKLGTIQNDSLQSLLLGEKMRIFIKDGRNVPAECQQCRWVNLCHGGCKRDRNTADKAQRSYYCKALQKFFAYAEPRNGPCGADVPLKRRQILLDKKNKYWQLFLSTFKLSACTFGGGFVIIPLMRERFVKELHWIEEEEMLDLTAIAQSSPGSIAINASILVGYHVAGIPGALITVVGSALPPLIIISIISAFYQAFRSNKYVSMAMAGMLAGVAAVIFDVVINMAWPILKKKRLLPIAVMLAAFVATRFFSVNIILIILVCGVIGALDTLYLQKKEVEE